MVKRREDRRKETKETQNAIEKGDAGGESMKQESQKKKMEDKEQVGRLKISKVTAKAK